MGRRRLSPLEARSAYESGADPASIRVVAQLGITNSRILMGADDLSEWDEEELRRGQRKDPKGRFVGKPPQLVPKKLHDELVKRTFAKAQALMNDSLLEAVNVLTELMNGVDVDDAVRLRAANLIIERCMGRTPETIVHTINTKPYQATMDRVITVRSRPATAHHAKRDSERGRARAERLAKRDMRDMENV